MLIHKLHKPETGISYNANSNDNSKKKRIN